MISSKESPGEDVYGGGAGEEGKYILFSPMYMLFTACAMDTLG